MSAAPTVAVFGSARLEPGDAEYEEIRVLGGLLARAGWTVSTGGYYGAMAAASEGAAGAGGHVVGVTLARWVDVRSANQWVAEERAAESLLARLTLLLEADAWVAVAGGMGTLAEVSVAWNLLQAGEVGEGRPLVLMGPRWRALVPLLRRHLVIGDHDLELARLAAGPVEAVAALGPPPT